jgi:hypothetical protein
MDIFRGTTKNKPKQVTQVTEVTRVKRTGLLLGVQRQVSAFLPCPESRYITLEMDPFRSGNR